MLCLVGRRVRTKDYGLTTRGWKLLLALSLRLAYPPSSAQVFARLRPTNRALRVREARPTVDPQALFRILPSHSLWKRSACTVPVCPLDGRRTSNTFRSRSAVALAAFPVSNKSPPPLRWTCCAAAPTRNQWQDLAEQEAQIAFPDDSLASGNLASANHNIIPADRSSMSSSGQGSGTVGGRPRSVPLPGGAGGTYYYNAYNNGNSATGAGRPRPLASSAFGGQRRYSGGTIGIASMLGAQLGSLNTVSTGRSISDGGIDRRVSSVLGDRRSSPDFGAAAAAGSGSGNGNHVNNGAAWRRQGGTGAVTGGGLVGGFGHPRWGSVRANGPQEAGWREEGEGHGQGAAGAAAGTAAVAGGLAGGGG